MVNINLYTQLLIPTISADISKTELQTKLINFYSGLKYANHMVSERKVACPIPITWNCLLKNTHNINSINCMQANIMLKLISSDFKHVGNYIRYATAYQQAYKFKLQQNRNGLMANDPNKIKKP